MNQCEEAVYYGLYLADDSWPVGVPGYDENGQGASDEQAADSDE